jgi:hypothetical protein
LTATIAGGSLTGAGERVFVQLTGRAGEQEEVGGVRVELVAFLDIVLVGAVGGGFALIGLAIVMWLLDWGHLLGSIGDGGPPRSARRVALVGAALLVAGLIGVLLTVRG